RSSRRTASRGSEPLRQPRLIGADDAGTLPPMSARPVLALYLGDAVRLRRAHPSGSSEWLVDRLGADIGLRCQGCGRHVLLDRRPREHRLDAFVTRGDPALHAAIAPRSAPEG